MDQIQIKCPECGEMYSSTYRRCPFCEEDGEGERRLAYGPKRRVIDRNKQPSALGWIIAVAVLVVGLVGWYVFGGNIAGRGSKPASGKNDVQITDQQPAVPVSNPGTGTSSAVPADSAPTNASGEETPGTTDASGEGGAQPIGVEQPTPDPEENVDVSGAKLNREDFTLSGVGDSFTVKVSGTEATPHWSIDNANVASLSPDGTVTAVANGRTTLRCKVGSRELTCIVRVNNTGRTAEPAAAPTSVEPVTPTAPATPGTSAASPSGSSGSASQSTSQPSPTPTPSSTHVDASSLKVKTNYGTTLQKDPDTGYPDCTVRIGGDPIALKISGTDVPVSSWTSDKPSVVEVSADGKLTPVSAGTAHVTAVVGDAEIICIIRVR
ncbi:MAG: Ig-like domain-containing protein [Oscillospiraceae bacterium]|nr:Ig-like domain-containing protein [Oscillospiraceae bacterium]